MSPARSASVVVFEMKPAAIYARFSTELQNEKSTEDQIAVCRTYAARHQLNVVATFEDKARSGASVFGRHAGGRAYGYRAVPGKPGELEIVEDEAAIVRRIFEAYAAGRTPREIAHDLNRENIRPPRGRRWNASTINGNAKRGAGLIFNELYSGRIVWNKV